MIPRLAPNYGSKELLAVFLPASKAAIKKLEEKWQKFLGIPNVFFYQYGRTGLYVLLKALGAQNKKVIMPSYSCVVVAHAVSKSGNTPVFLDNKPGSFQPCAEDYLSLIDDETVMVILTHLFGFAEETKKVCEEIKQKYPYVFVLQDCAHSFFVKDNTGRDVSAYGDGVLYGMNISKLVNSVHGGCLAIRNNDIASKVSEFKLKPYNLFNLLRERLYCLTVCIAFVPMVYGIIYFIIMKLGLFSKEVHYYNDEEVSLPENFLESFNPFQAKIASLSFDKFQKRIENRRKIAKLYKHHLAEIKGLELPPFVDEATWSHYPVLVPKELRQKLMEESAKQGVELGQVLEYSIGELSSYKGAENFPVSQDQSQRMINLPLTFFEIFPRLNPEESVLRIKKILINSLKV